MTSFTTTRFNNETWNENLLYRENANFHGCIYGAPQELSPRIEPKSLVFVVEMNNSTNQIMGIGLIRNVYVRDRSYHVYNKGNYNRYTFVGKYRIDRDDLSLDLLNILDTILFKGKTHLKRGAGFTSIPDKLYRYEICNEVDIKQEIINAFLPLSKFEKSREEYKELSV